MTAELARASFDSTPPFHGDTCVVKGLDLEQLWACYKIAVSLATAEKSYETYRDNQDWHWHDGIITRSGELSASEWATWIWSPDSLARAWLGEDWCHTTVYPPDMAWCLRFLYWEYPSEHPNELELDLSGDPVLIARFADAVRRQTGVQPEIEPSSQWFLHSGFTQNSPERLKWYFDQGWSP